MYKLTCCVAIAAFVATLCACDAKPPAAPVGEPSTSKSATTEPTPETPIDEAASVIASYYGEHGELPPVSHGQHLISEWREVRDQWGNHLRYTQTRDGGFEIRTSGKDASFDTDDDVVKVFPLRTEPGVERQRQRAESPPPQKQIMVRIWVNDDTERNPLPPKSELWFRGHGSWWIKPNTQYGTGGRDFGRRKVNESDLFFVYADGRAGKEIKVPFMMTAEMNPDGSHRSMIQVSISDDEVTVFGLPIRAATGKWELRFKR